MEYLLHPQSDSNMGTARSFDPFGALDHAQNRDDCRLTSGQCHALSNPHPATLANATSATARWKNGRFMVLVLRLAVSWFSGFRGEPFATHQVMRNLTGRGDTLSAQR
jgi:hypothetical protein